MKRNPDFFGKRDAETGLDYRGARFYDSDVARFLSLDPAAAKYPSLSDYCYVGGNPVMFIDPDGKAPQDIILGKGMTKTEVLQIVGTLQKLTDDKLVYNTQSDGTVQVKIASLGTGDKTAGTRLIRRLNSSDKTVTIQNGTNWTERDANSTTATDGTGSDATVNFAPTHLPNLPIEDSKTGNLKQEKSNSVTNFGHELIHAERSMRGEAIPYGDYGTQTHKDATGKTVTGSVRKEEAATVGVGYNKKKDITENDLRKEQGLSRRIKY